MYAINDAPLRARWQVLWTKDRRVFRKDFDHDLQAAMEVYARVVAAGRPNATLRCVNMSFPPPEKYADREVVIVHKGGRKLRGKRIIRPLQFQERMMLLNRRGAWWCPYCMKLRKFVQRKGFRVEGVWVPHVSLHCPMCNASIHDGSVRRWNPLSYQIELELERRRAPNGQGRRARRRRRQAAEAS